MRKQLSFLFFDPYASKSFLFMGMFRLRGGLSHWRADAWSTQFDAK